jgi:chromosome segregation ATPase
VSFALVIWFASIVTVATVATEIVLHFCSRRPRRPFNSHSQNDALDRQLRQALDTVESDVKNVAKNNELLAAALQPIDVALRTFSSRLSELEGKHADIIRDHSVGASRTVMVEKRVATQKRRSDKFDARLRELSDQVAALNAGVGAIRDTLRGLELIPEAQEETELAPQQEGFAHETTVTTPPHP